MERTVADTPTSEPKVLQAQIGGMHCVNCAVAVEGALASLPGVQDVHVAYPSGQARITLRDPLDVSVLQDRLAKEGYGLSVLADAASPVRPRPGARDFVEIAAVLLVLVAVALALQRFHLLPRGVSVSDEMSYGLVFAIGLIASVSSCLAVTGGLLVALAAKYNEANPSQTDRQRLVPHLYFNAGRLASYTLLGGAIGAIGSTLTLSPSVSGALTLVASLIMIVLGLSMLGLLPSAASLVPQLPKSFTRKIHDAAARETKGAALLLGAGTFFLPCGFTQALQLYVLSRGSFAAGALTMLAFALGTLPALLSLSAVSSLARGSFQRHFLRFAGAAVILLGVLNIRYGLVLTGSDMNAATAITGPRSAAGGEAKGVEPQRISMRVVGLDYEPHQFTVRQGVPVQWWIDASQADGCGRMLLAPRLGIRKLLSGTSTTVITFTPDRPGEYAFNCGMGMMTPDARITVLPNAKG